MNPGLMQLLYFFVVVVVEINFFSAQTNTILIFSLHILEF